MKAMTLNQQHHREALDALEGKTITSFDISQAMLSGSCEHGDVVESEDGERLMTIGARDASRGEDGAAAADDAALLVAEGLAVSTAATLGSRIRAAGGTVDGFVCAFRLTAKTESEISRVETALDEIRSGTTPSLGPGPRSGAFAAIEASGDFIPGEKLW